jgi:Methyltransferase domain
MEGYGPETYGGRIAEVYDEWFHASTSTEDAVEFLAGLAGGGPVLELAVGTGRIALPLAARGIEVHGIDASEAMVAKLRAKPGGEDIPVTIGDFADVGVESPYRLIAIVFNMLRALLTQEGQVRCVRNVADSRRRTARDRDVSPRPGPVRSRPAGACQDHRVPSCPAGRISARPREPAGQQPADRP